MFYSLKIPHLYLIFLLISLFSSVNAVEFGSMHEKTAELKSPDLNSESAYVKMPDGVRIAVDIVHPVLEQKTYPTIVWSTRYWRSFELRFFPSP